MSIPSYYLKGTVSVLIPAIENIPINHLFIKQTVSIPSYYLKGTVSVLIPAIENVPTPFYPQKGFYKYFSVPERIL